MQRFLVAYTIATIGFVGSSVSAQLVLGTCIATQPKQYVFGGDANLLNRKEVQEDLELSDQQRKQIREEFGKLMVTLAKIDRSATLPAPTDDVPKKMDEIFKPYNEGTEKLVKDVLTEKQLARFTQIAYQSRGLDPLFRPDVQKELQFTQAQLDNLRGLAEKRKKEPGKLSKQVQIDDARYLGDAVLLFDNEQKERWSKLVGKKLTLTPR